MSNHTEYEEYTSLMESNPVFCQGLEALLYRRLEISLKIAAKTAALIASKFI